MLHEKVIVPPNDDIPLHIVAKRYWVPELNSTSGSGQSSAAQALTLIFLHSTSFHKETWEPALEDLFDRIISQTGPIRGVHSGKNTSNGRVLVREAWAIDCPNHGESAELNHRVLESPGFASVSCEKYALAVHRFLSACPKLANGERVDFTKRNLVGIGHSLGGNAMLMLQRLQPTFKFSSLIIVEPMLSPEGGHHLHPLREKLVAGAIRRRDCWPSRDEARSHLKSLRATSLWDPRVIETFVNHAIHWRPESNSFVLSCTKKQEIIMYMDEPGPVKPVDDLNVISHSIPVHLILGEKKDFVPLHVHRSLTDPKAGRQFASIQSIPGVGHLIPQTIPSKVSKRIYDILVAEPALRLSRL
ncbi:Alpha/Beta hydrolase protein [Panaeolus papilionaceus]|nr:Alpha/Beta hydrolase protein [Panaeolus papilionaceus]